MSVAECEMWNEWCDRHEQVMWSGGGCGGCCEDEEKEPHTCHSCGTTLTDAEFEKGKMCCDQPLFHDDEEEEDTWEDVYATYTIRKDDTMAAKNNMTGAIYYQTYGGGPSGGWVVKDGVVYAACKKGMFCEWEYVAKPGCRLEFIAGTSTSYKKVKLSTLE